MKSIFNTIKAISTGFIVLLLISLLLFWLRLLCDSMLLENASQYSIEKITIKPSGLIPENIENDPNVTQESFVTASFTVPNLQSLGIIDYFSSIIAEEDGSTIYSFNMNRMSEGWSGYYFDKQKGLIVYHSNKTEVTPDNKKQKRAIDLYAGPEGISEVPDKKLGRFSSFLSERMYFWGIVTLYDKNMRCFYSINFNDKKIIKGPQLSKDDIHKPVQIGSLFKNYYITNLNLNPPLISTSKTDTEESSNMTSQDMDVLSATIYFENKYLLVLNESNRIYLLDKESFEFTGIAGNLPVPDTLFKSKRQPDKKGLLSYMVKPVFFGPGKEYKGMLAASLNREGTSIALSVYDPNGQQINAKQSGINDFDNSWAKAIYFDIPWGPTLTICKYLLENLQAPVFSLVSYFTADSFEAGSGHRALFILPNSFVAMKGRNSQEYFIGRFFGMIILILPSIILSIVLAGRVGKDANNVGLTYNERKAWQIAMICFGLVAYITYRLTCKDAQPCVSTLVTCQNCGKLRRPDMDLCHQCKSPWHVPELTPPSWKVVDM